MQADVATSTLRPDIVLWVVCLTHHDPASQIYWIQQTGVAGYSEGSIREAREKKQLALVEDLKGEVTEEVNMK